MHELDIARAWKDKSYFDSLSPEDQARVPPDPAGPGIQLYQFHDRVLALVPDKNRHDDRQEPEALPEVDFTKLKSAFLLPFEPLIADGLAELQRLVDQKFNNHEPTPFDHRTIIQLLYPSLRDRILSLVTRTLTLELHTAKIKGVLTGNTAEERFASFARRMAEPPNHWHLLEEYPVLLRLVSDAVSQWRETSVELVFRLAENWQKILQHFLPHGPTVRLSSVVTGLGDRHRQGRSVTLLTFDSGFRLVYKPRTLKADIRFQLLLQWLGNASSGTTFKTLKVFDQNEYGWSEFVERKKCVDKEGLGRFYRRLGGCLALLYVLGANDFHSENLIADSEYPVLLDLETLFTPRAQPREESPADWGATGAIFTDSVLETGVLPWYTDLGGGMGTDDDSGLGAIPGRLSRIPELMLERAGTDEMRIVRRAIHLPEGKNRPLLGEVDIQPSSFENEITQGFVDIYETIMANKEDFHEEIETLFANVQVRSVPRPTRAYALLLLDSIHPAFLRDAVTRIRKFDWLWRVVAIAPWMERVVPHEIRDLSHGDIPYFFTTPTSYDLVTSSGETISEFFSRSGFDVFRERLAALGRADLDRQLWMIRSSLRGC